MISPWNAHPYDTVSTVAHVLKWKPLLLFPRPLRQWRLLSESSAPPSSAAASSSTGPPLPAADPPSFRVCPGCSPYLRPRTQYDPLSSLNPSPPLASQHPRYHRSITAAQNNSPPLPKMPIWPGTVLRSQSTAQARLSVAAGETVRWRSFYWVGSGLGISTCEGTLSGTTRGGSMQWRLLWELASYSGLIWGLGLRTELGDWRRNWCHGCRSRKRMGDSGPCCSTASATPAGLCRFEFNCLINWDLWFIYFLFLLIEQSSSKLE